jgi:hypothetical protein
MGSMLCVTRSPAGDIRAQKGAVRIARDSGEPQVFLTVADGSFPDKLAVPIVVDISNILMRMSWYPLCAAIECASAGSVTAKTPARNRALSSVPDVASEFDASTLIGGQLTGDLFR